MEARIVIIHNDENMRDLLTLSLKREGWQVFGYSYAWIELADLKQHRPDLIILDFTVGTAEGTGWELLQLLKMDDTTAKIPVLITTTALHLSAEVRGYLLTRYIKVVPNSFYLKTFLALVHKTLTLASQAGVLFSSDHPLPILVVDDTEDLREAIVTVLRLEGYEVVTAPDGLVALEIVSRAEHCLILLDMSMPIMNGYEFLRAYDRQLRPHSPVIILTGNTEILTGILPAFVIDVIPKPFEISHLLKLISKYAQPV
ncbi:MAG: response regulator [Anaerolineae bacterium]|nr:response regulator [Anaerolineae bacterium]